MNNIIKSENLKCDLLVKLGCPTGKSYFLKTSLKNFRKFLKVFWNFLKNLVEVFGKIFDFFFENFCGQPKKSANFSTLVDL